MSRNPSSHLEAELTDIRRYHPGPALRVNLAIIGGHRTSWQRARSRRARRAAACALANDTAYLVAEIQRLHDLAAGTRMALANMRAAALAALSAAADGEADPLSYLRDELNPAGREVSR